MYLNRLFQGAFHLITSLQARLNISAGKWNSFLWIVWLRDDLLKYTQIFIQLMKGWKNLNDIFNFHRMIVNQDCALINYYGVEIENE